jgi:outer membrane protein assembly factor BamB
VPPAEPARRARQALGAALLLAGCARPTPPPPAAPAAPAVPSWPIARGDRGLRGVAEGALPQQPVLRWSYQTGNDIVSSPVVADGRVYIGSDDYSVYCLDFDDGARIWSYATGDLVEAPPLVHRGTVYVGSDDFFMYALDAADGSLRFRFEAGDKITGSANWLDTPQGTRIVFGSYDARLYCIDAADGTLIWSYETQNYVNGTPAVVEQGIVFGGCDGSVYVLSPEGTLIHRVELCPECHIAGSAAAEGGRAYLGHYGNAFVAIDLEAGRIAWTYGEHRHPFFAPPALGSDRVVFGGRDKQLHCVRRADGAPLWTFPTRRKVDGGAVICGDRVVFGSGDGRLSIVSLEDGKELWAYDVGRPIHSSPAVTAGTILFGAGDGRVYAFGSAATSP